MQPGMLSVDATVDATVDAVGDVDRGGGGVLLSEEVFQLDGAGGLLVTVLDDDGAVEVDAAFQGLAAADDGF